MSLPQSSTLQDNPLYQKSLSRKNLNQSFSEAFRSRERDLYLYGGADSGKSYAAAQKVILKCQAYPKRRILVIRKYKPSLKRTCWKLIVETLETWNVEYEKNLTEMDIRFKNGSEILFIPVVTSTGEPAERIKSMTDITDMWFEEPTELSYNEYLQIRRRLRGGIMNDEKLDIVNAYAQRIYSFNPVDQNHWLKTKIFDKDEGDWFQYTYRDNQFAVKEEIQDLEDLKEQDENQYRIYAKGEWGVFQNKIYNNYEVKEFELNKANIDDIICGVDFGFVHPSVWLLLVIKENTVMITDEIYEKGLTNPEFIELIKAKQIEHDVNPPTYCDNAEPARIEDMEQEGMLVYPAYKDIVQGIDVVQKYKLLIHPRCVHTIKEIQSYKRREDRQGNVLEEPVKFKDDAMDALRYGLATHRRMNQKEEQYESVIEYEDDYVNEGKF